MSPRFKYCCPFSYILYAYTYYPQLLYLSSPLYILTSFIVYNDASIHIVALIVYNVPLYNSTSFLVYNAPLYNWTSFLVYIVAPNRPCISSLVKEQGIGVLYEVIKYGRGDHFQWSPKWCMLDLITPERIWSPLCNELWTHIYVYCCLCMCSCF